MASYGEYKAALLELKTICLIERKDLKINLPVLISVRTVQTEPDCLNPRGCFSTCGSQT